MKKFTSFLITLLLFGWGYSQPPNNACANAITITGNGVISGTTVGSTNSGTATCGTTSTTGDVWYTFTDTSGTGSTVTVHTCTGTTYDSKITVFSGSCGALVCVGGNDDSCGLQSQVIFTTDGSSTYYVMVHGFGTATGPFDLTVSGFPTGGGGGGDLWQVTVQDTGWGDEVSWQLRDASNTVLLSGGPYGLGYFDQQSVTTSNEPLEFFIESMGTFNDNTPQFLVTCGGETVVQGQLAGGAQQTFSGLVCPGGGGVPVCEVDTFPFTETFEANSPSRDCWTQIQEVGAGNWTFATGSSGGSINTAYNGTLNARFVSLPPGMGGTPVTKLVSPVMDLSALGAAEMQFYYGQEVWAGDQNFLRVYYRVSDTDPWVQIAFYNTNIPVWTQATLQLPDVSSTYQVAFEGINNWGRANVIDDVTVRASPPPNDLIQNAISITSESQPYTDPAVRMQYATNELLNPNGCAIAGANGVWYKFTAEIDGTAEGSITTPAGTSAMIFFESPNENVTNETQLTFNFESTNQCAPGTMSSITTSAGQSYYVFVLNTGGASDVVLDISGSLLSAEDFTIDGFVFYPNPVTNILNLKSNVTIDQVELFTVLGQSVMTRSINTTSSQLDVSRLATGVYLMKVTADGQTATYQVIKK